MDGIRGQGWRRRLGAGGVFLAAALVFSLAHGLSPLYTINQDSYFLHGLADAGRGFLAADWLAGTADPFPLFSLLVRLTAELLDERLFYVYTMLLNGIYVISLAGLALAVDGRPVSWGRAFAVFAVLTALQAGVWGTVTAVGLGLDLARLVERGVANQYLLGLTLQPSMFGVLLPLSILLFLRGRAGWAGACLGMAVLMHFSYLLSAAVLAAAYGGVLWQAGEGPRRALRPGLAAVIIGAPALVYALAAFRPSSAAAWTEAQRLLVHVRFPHHALPAVWFDGEAALKLALVGVGLLACRRTRLFPILLMGLLAAAALTLAQVLLHSDGLALLFPWRLSAVLVPAAAAAIVGGAGRWLARRLADLRWPVLALLAILLLILVAGELLLTARRFQAHTVDDPALPMLAHLRASGEAGQVYLVPPDLSLQRFRLDTGLPIVVDYKSHPYRDVEVVEWFERLSRVEVFYQGDGVDCGALAGLAEAYRVTHLVLPADRGPAGCAFLTLDYADDAYRVYAAPGIASGGPAGGASKQARAYSSERA